MNKRIASCCLLLVIIMLLSLCSTGLALPTQSPEPTSITTPEATAPPAETPAPTPTPVPLPALTLREGDLYFSVAETPEFVFSRNVSGSDKENYGVVLDWAKSCGNRFIRICIDSIGLGYMKGMNGTWAARWDVLFDMAEAKGIYVLPVLSGWMDWNIWEGPSNWKKNPLNEANGGPVKDPQELFVKGSEMQTMWLEWMRTVVERFKRHRNILAWEIYCEVNLTVGIKEPAGIDFINTAAAIVRETDPGRLVTASLADIGTWPNFYKATELDFIQIHPYLPSAKLDRALVSEARNHIEAYGKPVIIGECGLNAESPLKNPENEELAIRHSIWAGLISGSMNGRSLFWEDSFGQYIPGLGIPWLKKFSAVELPAAEFVKGIDFAGFAPLKDKTTKGVWGAAIGKDTSIIGWFRDAACEPPKYRMKEVVSKQSVKITVPGNAASWRVDFYSTADGVTLLGSVTVSRSGKAITIPLPDFHDDIAFKAYAQ